MARVGTRSVVTSGLLHFVGDEVAATGTTPALIFRRGGTVPNTVTVVAHGPDFILEIQLDPGLEYGGRAKVNVGINTWEITYIVRRFAEMPDGTLYEVRYTLTSA